MSGEHPNTDTEQSVDTSVDANVETPAIDDAAVTAMYADWDGEVESLESQPFFTDIEKLSPDQLREAIKTGYGKARNNITSALHTKATALSQAKGRYDTLSSTLEERAQAFSERLTQLQEAANTSEGEGVNAAQLEALKAGLQTQVSELQLKLKEAEDKSAEYYKDNATLMEGYRKMKWGREQDAQNYQAQLQAAQTNLQAKINELTQERDRYRGSVEESRIAMQNEAFETAFPYLAKDERRTQAQELYQNSLRALLQQLPEGQSHYPDETWKMYEKVTQAQVMAQFPELNKTPPAPTDAERLMQEPGGEGSGTKPARTRRKPSHVGGIF